MTTAIREIKAADLRIVRLDVTIWTARAKLRPEDLPADANLPPKDLATLGSKRLYDPAKMRIFGTLKERARCILGQNGTRFMDAYAIDPKKLDEVMARVGEVKRDFDDAVADLLRDYEHESREWITAHPEWSHIIRAVMPTPAELARRFHFGYQAFRISAEPLHESGFDTEMQGLVPTAIKEISQMVDEFLRRGDEDKEWTKRTLASVDRILHKVESAVYLDQRLGQLYDVMRQGADALRQGGYTNAATVTLFKNFLLAIRDEHSLDRLCSAYAASQHVGSADGVSIGDIMAALDGVATASAQSSEPVTLAEEVVQVLPASVAVPAPMVDATAAPVSGVADGTFDGFDW